MTQSTLLAGVLGGLIGGGAAVAAMRLLPPLNEPARGSSTSEPVATSPEARQVAEAFLGKLKALKYNEFVSDVKKGMTFLNDMEFEALKKEFIASRTIFHGVFGKLTEEYELVRETVLRPDLVRLVYLEKFERGAVAWFFILLKTNEGWRLNGIVWNKDLVHAFPNAS